MLGRMAALHAMDIEIPGFQIDLMPSEGHEFRCAEAMAKQHEDNSRIAHGVAPGFAGRLHHGVLCSAKMGVTRISA
jgi:hypothetical protein